MPIANIDRASFDYNRLGPLWRRNKDFNLGGYFVRAAGTDYLPPLSRQQTDRQFQDYVDNAPFIPVVGHIVELLTGRIAGNAPTTTNTNTEDITLSGLRFDEVFKDTVEEAVLTRHNGLLVDATPDGQAFIKHYGALEVIAWDYDDILPTRPLVYVKIRETFRQTDLRDFTEDFIELFRVLELDQNGVYRHRVYQRGDNASISLLSDTIPLVDGQPLDFIPFYFLHGDYALKTPLVSDVADLVQSHYLSLIHI